MIERFYSDITVLKPIPSVGSFGNQTNTWDILGTVRGFIERASAQDILAGNQEQNKITNNLFYEYPAPIEIKLGYKVVFEGKNYKVATHPEDVSSRHHHMEALLSRMDTDE